MARHLLALVIGEADEQFTGHPVEAARKPGQRGIGPAIVHLGQDDEAAFALDQCADRAGIARALDEIALPVAEQLPRQHAGGAFVDRGHADQPAASVLGRARSPLLALLAQQANDFLADFTTRQHVDSLVDGLVRDLSEEIVIVRHGLEPARNLLRRPALADLAKHMIAQGRPFCQLDRAAAAAAQRAGRSRRGVIAGKTAPVATQFPANRRTRSPELRCNLRLA